MAKQARLGPVAIYTHLDSSTTTASAGAAKGPLRRVRDDLWVQNLASGAKRFVFVFWTKPAGRSARRRVHRPPLHGDGERRQEV